MDPPSALWVSAEFRLGRTMNYLIRNLPCVTQALTTHGMKPVPWAGSRSTCITAVIALEQWSGSAQSPVSSATAATASPCSCTCSCAAASGLPVRQQHPGRREGGVGERGVRGDHTQAQGRALRVLSQAVSRVMSPLVYAGGRGQTVLTATAGGESVVMSGDESAGACRRFWKHGAGKMGR